MAAAHPVHKGGLKRSSIRAAVSSSEPCSRQTRSKAMNDNRHQDGIYPFP
ncbi:MAG: hypothetical protein QOI90_927, partial [Mycobacterium sp.]|nr:hypothetical protein [Mycobacterium sp.]